MDVVAILVASLLMGVGLVGIVVPVLPGLVLVEVGGLAWVLLAGPSVGRWSVFAAMSVLFVVGMVAQWVLPTRSITASGAPRSTLWYGGAGSLVGFFVVPVVGAVLGGVVGVFLAEQRRTGDTSLAWRSTRGVLKAVGIGVLIEVGAGVAMVVTWITGVAALA